jgi:hypothetical protein
MQHIYTRRIVLGITLLLILLAVLFGLTRAG